jgi:uncharacterized membrane protein
LTTSSKPTTQRSRDFSFFADKAIFNLAVHWLALANLFWGLYVGLPLLAPILMNAGWTTPAKVIYTVYRPACHQLPERSYFLGGPQYVYSAEVGWKMAFCQRDVAIYGSIFLTGLVYALVRRRLGNWKMPFRYYLLFLVPMGMDGLLQLFGLHESTWLLRTISGAIFGAGSALFAYPYLEEGFRDVRRSTNSRRHQQAT